MDVDVVIPMYNGEKYIARALDSVLMQSKKVKQIIVINDGSDDSGPSIVNDYQKFNKSIIQITTENMGLSAARNLGIMATDSTFVALLDCDDYWGNKKIENQINYLQQNPDVSAIFSQCYINNEQSGKIEKVATNKHFEFSYENLFLQRFRIIGSASSVCLRVDELKDIGLFDEKMKYGEDYELWIRLAKRIKFVELKERDVYITKRENSMQSKKSKGIDAFRNSIMYFYVWNKHNIEISNHESEFKKLIWPDIRQSIFRQPANIRNFFSFLEIEFPSEYKYLFGTKIKKFSFLFITPLFFTIKKYIKKI